MNFWQCWCFSSHSRERILLASLTCLGLALMFPSSLSDQLFHLSVWLLRLFRCVSVNCSLFCGNDSRVICYNFILSCVMHSFILLHTLAFCSSNVVCNRTDRNCRIISKQMAKSLPPSALSLPPSPVISIFHLLSLLPHPSFLLTLLQLCLPNFHLTHFLSQVHTHTFPPLLLSVHPDICLAFWAAACAEDFWLFAEWLGSWGYDGIFWLNTHLFQLSEHTKSQSC